MQQKPLKQAMQQGMNWNDLRYFLALAQQGSVSGAGRALSVEHTTVARRVSALEKQLGSRLFDRLPSGYVMTQVAENLLPHALAMQELMQVADREVFAMDAQLSGSLKLTASYDVFSRLITPKLERFVDQYPGIDLQLLSSTSLADLASRQADIALRLSPNPPEYLIGRKVLPLQHGIYASASYLKKKRHTEQLVLWEHEGKTPQWVNDHFSQARVVARANEIMTMMEAVKNNLGLARLPCYVGDAEPQLRRLDLSLTPSSWGVWVLSHIDLRSTARVRVCREFLIDIIKEQRELIEGLGSRYF
ncbi:MAG: LysR family transcriptional regulator [Pseudomonadales bacterium]|nr:LysR family transcriptional regulator [Pseudomonadales bacterium]NRA14583.1 LysR family transcriptional regulator [Oceanospirillaceae bacterium]